MASMRVSSLLLAAVGISFLAGCGAVFLNEGAKTASLADGLQNPQANKPKVNIPKDQCVVGNFDDGSKNVDPKLYGGGGGLWMALSSGGGGDINSAFIVDGGANGTPKAIHVFGKLTDKGDKSYPGFQVQCKLKDHGYFDASNFTGIQFYYNCPPDDQALKRRFGIGTAPTLPGDQGGTCSTGCYDNFGADLAPTSDWVKKVLPFSDIKREGWGGPVAPPDFTDHLAELINLGWTHSANNMAGTYNIDYWVDEVEFF